MAESSRHHHFETLRLREALYDAPDPRLAEAIYYAGMFADNATDILVQYRRAAAMLRERPGGNNFPFLLQSLAGHTAWAGRFAEADSLLHEAEIYAEQHFLPGSQTERYRVPILHILAIHRVEARLALGDWAGVTNALARADSLLRLAATESARLYDSQVCVEGMIASRQADWPTAEARLRACLGADQNIRFRYRAAVLLVALLDAHGREHEADAYRDLARQASVFADSLTHAYESLLR